MFKNTEKEMKKKKILKELKERILKDLKILEKNNSKYVRLYENFGVLDSGFWRWNFKLEDYSQLLLAYIRCYFSNLNTKGVNFKETFTFIYNNFDNLPYDVLKKLSYAILGDNKAWHLGVIFRDFIYDSLHRYLKNYYNITSYDLRKNIISNIEFINFDKFYKYVLNNNNCTLKELFKKIIFTKNLQIAYNLIKDYSINLLETYLQENSIEE